MRKTRIIVTAIVLVLIVILAYVLIIQPTITGKTLDNFTQTKAICNETNYCQDYHISCDGNRMVIMTPITGAAIQHKTEWIDPRTEEQKKLCSIL